MSFSVGSGVSNLRSCFGVCEFCAYLRPLRGWYLNVILSIVCREHSFWVMIDGNFSCLAINVHDKPRIVLVALKAVGSPSDSIPFPVINDKTTSHGNSRVWQPRNFRLYALCKCWVWGRYHNQDSNWKWCWRLYLIHAAKYHALLLLAATLLRVNSVLAPASDSFRQPCWGSGFSPDLISWLLVKRQANDELLCGSGSWRGFWDDLVLPSTKFCLAVLPACSISFYWSNLAMGMKSIPSIPVDLCFAWRCND